MLPVNYWRTLCSSRVLLHPNWLMTNQHSGYRAVTCSALRMSINDTSFPKNTWHSNMNLKAPRKERELIYSTNSVGPLRNYCTGQVKLNCWNCKRPLDKTLAFFCLSCKVVQPPEEGTSYFKIMDW